jgi:TatA/E family protein of Tat protein translocase
VEIIFILVIVFIIFGAGKLPQLFELIGKGIRVFRREKKEGKEIDKNTYKQGAYYHRKRSKKVKGGKKC